MFKVLFIGDIVGRSGRNAVNVLLPLLKQQYKPDYVVANGENAASGFGLSKNIYDELIYDLGINLLTSGNHIWDKKEIFKEIEDMDKLIRPLNYPECQFGEGYRIDEVNGVRICTINLLGRVFVHWNIDCPFRTIDKLLEELKGKADVILVDMHAEVTSEKKALGFYLDGRVAAVLGTHTHIQTADERILPQGTGYLSDVGMVGAINSVLGMNAQTAQNRFLYGIKERFEVALDGKAELNACYLEIDPATGKTTKIERIYREYEGK